MNHAIATSCFLAAIGLLIAAIVYFELPGAITSSFIAGMLIMPSLDFWYGCYNSVIPTKTTTTRRTRRYHQ